jgi:hypothetical protein
MYRYELTERGKIVIALMLVLLLLLIPSAILLCTAIASQPPKPLETQGSGAPESESPTPPPAPPPTITPTPVITESPPPSGGDFNHGEDAAGDDNNETEEHTPSKPPELCYNDDSITEGIFSFVFFPDGQDLLYDRTLSMLYEFINSPQNTDDSSIAIEIPKLLAGDMDKLRHALNSAFTGLGISEQRLVYVTNSSPIADGAFKVSLSFIPLDIK